MVAPIIKSTRMRMLAAPLVGVLLLVLLAVFGPMLVSADPTAMNLQQTLAGPSMTHLLGQDEFGRDVLSRLLHGGRVSLSVALLATLLAAAVGISAGLIGGYFGGFAEFLTLRFADVVLSFPPILLALLIVTLSGPGATTLTFVLAVLYAPKFARVVYGEVLSLKNLEYVEAMRSLGAGDVRILLRTVLPNTGGPVLVQFSLTVSAAIVVESGLSFLGLGVTPPSPSWGLMIRSARSYMEANPLGLLWPCLSLILVIFAVNALCDRLRDIFDPRTVGAAQRLTKGVDKPAASPATAPEDRPEASDAQLSIHGLRTEFKTAAGSFAAVNDVSFALKQGETLAVVGESGSGKSVTCMSIMGLLPHDVARIANGRIMFVAKDGQLSDLAAIDAPSLRKICGNDIAIIFQEPLTSLNPVYKIGAQIAEAIRAHQALSRAEARAAALDLLRRVGMSDPERRLDQYPHELSGGMRQRVLIALALSCEPSLLIADEPTTALDVTIQAEILALIKSLQGEHGMSVLFITHNLGIVAQIADRVSVMYAGRVVESATTLELFASPRHPYTKSLLGCVPRMEKAGAPGERRERLTTIPGTVPGPFDIEHGCAFAPRCSYADSICHRSEPAMFDVGGTSHTSRCFHWSAL